MTEDYFGDVDLQRGDPVTVHGPVARRRGPHKAVVLNRLASGRVRVLVLLPQFQNPGRVIAIVDPANLSPRIFRAAPISIAPSRRPDVAGTAHAYVRFQF